MADHLAKLKKTRGLLKAAITSLVKKIEDIWESDSPDPNELEEILDQLIHKGSDLKREDSEIIKLIDDLNEVEKDAKASLEYHDKIIIWKFRINKKVKQNLKNENSTVTLTENKNKTVESVNVKLPTLKIERYYGDISEFQNFWNSYKVAIDDNNSLSPIEKLNYLRSYLGGEALATISGLTLCEDGYREAINIITEQFGRKDLLVTTHINKLLALKPVYRSNDIISLRKLFNIIQTQIRNLKSLEMKSDSFDALLTPIILKTLPSDLCLEFNKQCVKNANYDNSVEDLLSFIQIELQAREKHKHLFANASSESSRSFQTKKKIENPEVFRVSTKLDESKEINCVYCSSPEHLSEKCNKVSIDQKLLKLKNDGRCFCCLKRKHLIRDCLSKKKCVFCNRFHHISLCDRLFGNSEDKKESNSEKEKNVLVSRVNSNFLFNLEEQGKGWMQDRWTGKKERNGVIKSLPTLDIECNNKIIQSIIDSGTQISIIRSSCVPEYFKNPCGSVILKSAFGHELKAPLINIPLSIATNEINYRIFPKVIITCAMVDNLINDLLLSWSAYQELNNLDQSNFNETITQTVGNVDVLCRDLNVLNLIDMSVQNDTPSANTGQDIELETILSNLNFAPPETAKVNANSLNVLSDSSDNFISDSDNFKSQQKDDPSLAQCWVDAANKTNNYFIKDNFLYHRDKLLGENVLQLVVPEPRRKQLLELAHSSPWGGHLRKKKTTQRMKYSFYWPQIKSDVHEFCEKCLSCQLRAKPDKFDNVPITPVTRPDEAFQIINCDIIGPIEPASGGYKYILCAVDQCTRWPEAVCLRNISAKSTCEALLQIFSRTGIPKLIASDQGSNFTSALTQEFMKRLGTAPRFSVPGYAKSNGLVERWNGVLKGMIHHVTREHSGNWHKHLPFLLWAYREVPNATTDVSPFEMLYGRRPTGPLSILKSSWTNETPLPCGQLGTVTNYLNDLKIKLEKAAEHAGISCRDKQQAYAYYHNRKTRHKEFKPNDQVIVLTPDSSHKMYARWIAPATIIKKKSPYSYLVQLPDNSVKHLHASKIKELKVQTTHYRSYL